MKCHGWSANIPSLVTLHPKGGHTLSKIYQKELCYKLEILHLDLTLALAEDPSERVTHPLLGWNFPQKNMITIPDEHLNEVALAF